jgi:hypothetical protein
MRVANTPVVRSSLLLVLLAAKPASADPLWDAELRAGYGVATGGSGMTTTRKTPLTITALTHIAVNEDPPLAGYGGVTVETLDRNSVGAVFGVKLAVGEHIRLAGGGTYIIAPYDLWGATASGGACTRAATTLSVCGDLQLTSYFAGSDLANNHAVTQIQLVLGMVLDGGTR